MLSAKVPIETSIQFIWGYISSEPDEVQFTIIANLLMRFLAEKVPQRDHAAALQAILDTLPIAALVNTDHVGGVQ